MSARVRHLALGGAVAVAVVCVIRWALAHWDGLYDDSFIYLRYAKNLEKCPLSYNCSDAPVEGFTSPLYLALLWFGSWFTNQLIWLCQVIGTIAVCTTIALAALTARALRRDLDTWTPTTIAIATAGVLALDPFVTLNTVNGMETALGGATVTLFMYAVVRQRPWLVVVATVASVLVRPESALFALALPALPWMRRWRLLAVTVGVLLVIEIARYVIFGQLFPNTYVAKSGGTWRHAAIGLEYILDAIRDFPLVLLAPLALFAPLRREVAVLLGVAFVWLAFFLRSGGDLFEYSRLWYPLVPGLSALALVGVHEFLSRKHERVAVLAALLVAIVMTTRAAITHYIPPQGVSDRIVLWAATGTYLRKNFKGATVATVPIGAIGYYSSLAIIDLVGLTDATIAREGRSVPPELLTKRWIGHERNFTEYVLSREPAVIVTTSVRSHPWRNLAEARAGFWADWLLVQEIKNGRAPYRVHDAEVLPGQHTLMFVRASPATSEDGPSNP
jgi:hypothetical protein